MGCGAVLIAPSGSHYQHSKATAFSGCNNEAELRAVGMAAGALLTLGAKTAIFFTDNLFVLEHMQPSTTKRAVHKLARLADEIKVLMEPLQNVQWQWIPRHRNTEADTLARAALGLPPKIKPPSGRKIKRRS